MEQWVTARHRTPRHATPLDDPVLAAFLQADQDLPIYLDSLLVYLRIQADSLAAVIPYFYERSGTIPARSFREQAKWFCVKRPDFDPSYSRILNDGRAWFDALADEGDRGLRNVVMHGSGINQTGFDLPASGDAVMHTGLLNAAGFVTEDLHGAIREVSHGWCRFLDDVWMHFSARLAIEIGFAALADEHRPRYMGCSGSELASFWAYPRSPGGA